jgi:hypothetical protein
MPTREQRIKQLDAYDSRIYKKIIALELQGEYDEVEELEFIRICLNERIENLEKLIEKEK